MSQCVVIDSDGERCTKDVRYSQGWCPMHYQRWVKHHDVRWEPSPPTVDERFWTKVNKSGAVPPHCPELGPCWIWTASAKDDGRGHGEFFVSPDEGKIRAHHYPLELFIGPRPAGMEGCHRCDNPPCVNPDHLYWGTRQDNVDDAVERGRHPRGETNGQALLKEGDIVAIRERYAMGEFGSTLAAEFGVTEAAISAIVRGRNWQHVGGPITTQNHLGRRTRTHCLRGHEFTEESTYWYKGQRSCRICKHLRYLKRKEDNG